MNNGIDLYLIGESNYYYFGWSVSNSGDVNNDGYSDVLVGAPGGYGRSYIYYGGISMNSTADVTTPFSVGRGV